MNNLYTPGRPRWHRSISLSFTLMIINHIKSCPSYWHHTFIYLTSPFSYHLYSETSHRPFHISSILISTSYKHVRSVQEPRPNSACHEVISTAAADYPPLPAANQRTSSWRVYLTSRITPRANMTDNTSAHDIPTSNIILRRKYIIPSDITVPNPYLLHKLTWKKHFSQICSNISFSIFFINKVKYTLPAHALKSLYYSLIHCHMIYGLLGAASLG